MISTRKCIVAPTRHFYKYCPDCGYGNKEETWRYAYCSKNCRDIFELCNNFYDGIFENDINKLKILYSKLDLTEYEFFSENIKETLSNISETIDKYNQNRIQDKKDVINDVNKKKQPKRRIRKKTVNEQK